jgi:formylglycine-generating enzyme required for sulfatase activity
VLLEALLAQIVAAPAPPAAPPPAAFACPPEMVAVDGVHHEYVQRICLHLEIGKCWSFLPGFIARESRVTRVRTCMDRYEWPNERGKQPAVMMSFVEAERLCAGAGKRLCTEFEWETACEGPETLPFPYGQRVDDAACNTAKPYRPVSEAKLASRDARVREAETRRLWQGEPSGAYPRCVSRSGAIDLVGNVEEWVQTSRPEWPFRSALKGGYWSKRWAGCRGTNDSHGPEFRFYEVGLRCCKDAPGAR